MSKISDLSDGGVIQGGDTLIAVRSGGNVKVTYGGSTTANIDGGTIDGTVIGGTTAAAGSFTSLTSTGIDVTGVITTDGLTSDGVATVRVTSAGATAEALTVYNTSNSNNSQVDVYFGSNDYDTVGRGLRIEAGRDSGADGIATFYSVDQAEHSDYEAIKILTDGGVTLSHLGSNKLATTSTGIDVTGTVTADGLTVDGGAATTLKAGGFTANSETVLELAENRDGSNNLHFGFKLKTDGAGDNNFHISRHNNSTTGNKALSVDRDTGTISFYEDTGTTAKFVWDSSAESLGIGTDSPARQLTVENAGGNAIASIKSGTSSASFLLMGDTASDNIGMLKYNNADNSLGFFAGSNSEERMRIDSAGQVSIGTDSPSSKLHLSGNGDSASKLTVQRTGATTGTTVLGYNYIGTFSNNEFKVFTNSTEAMRIDSSQNVLVGKTASNTGVAGMELRPTIAVFTADGDRALQINRLNSDGELQRFIKDGTTVGSVGTRAGFLTIGEGAVGLLFQDSNSRIEPTNMATLAATNGVVDIGGANQRFKDLYLSGGAYLGGTGSANHLDDYEEGTWTPTINSGTISATEATYTKIGNVVTLRANIGDISDNTTATDINISGLPFTASSTNRAVGSSMFRYFSKTNMAQVTPYVGQSRTFIEFYVSFNSNSTWAPLQFDDGAQANMDLIFSITYIA